MKEDAVLRLQEDVVEAGEVKDVYLRDGVDLHDLLLREFRGPSSACSYDVARFPGAVFHNRIPPRFTRFVDDEVRALVDRGGVV